LFDSLIAALLDRDVLADSLLERCLKLDAAWFRRGGGRCCVAGALVGYLAPDFSWPCEVAWIASWPLMFGCALGGRWGAVLCWDLRCGCGSIGFWSWRFLLNSLRLYRMYGFGCRCSGPPCCAPRRED